MLGCMNRILVNGNGVNLLLDDIWYWDFVMNFVWMWNFNFFDDRNLNNFDFWDSLRVMFMLGVMWILSFYGAAQKKKTHR